MQRLRAVLFFGCISSFVSSGSAARPGLSYGGRYDPPALPECGAGAPPGQEICPLGLCCSKDGHCGMTAEHCGIGCQSNCHFELPKMAACTSDNSSSNRSVAYYESWATVRPCDVFKPTDIDPSNWTHINFAFAILDTSTHKIALSASNDTELYNQTIALKSKKKDLKVYIAVGGWGVGGKPFSDMASSSSSRKAFIDSAAEFMDKYGFDGIDIDWEYPAATDRGGNQADTKNLVSLLKELKDKLKGKKGITVTIPGGSYYMKGFDLKGMEPHIDWVNVMSYDLHGSWDTPKLAQPHTNLTEIDSSLDLLWSAGFPASKVTLGLAYYGHTFTLSSTSCTKPGCEATGPGKKGECSGEEGTLINSEIKRIISDKKLKPVLDKTAGIKYVTWDDDQWVSYDDDETFKLKKDFANSKCLGGTMAWAVDMDSPSK